MKKNIQGFTTAAGGHPLNAVCFVMSATEPRVSKEQAWMAVLLNAFLAHDQGYDFRKSLLVITHANVLIENKKENQRRA